MRKEHVFMRMHAFQQWIHTCFFISVSTIASLPHAFLVSTIFTSYMSIEAMEFREAARSLKESEFPLKVFKEEDLHCHGCISRI